MPRISAIQRLKELDPVFSLADLQAGFGLEPGMARLYSTRWVKAGLTQRFGGGVYFNLMRDEMGPERRIPEALRKLLAVPFVVTGGAAIHAGGWTTQIHRRIDIAVPVIRGSLTVPRVEGNICLTPRYAGWFRHLASSAKGGMEQGLPHAAPAMALADALLSAHRSLSSGHPTSLPPPDELDMGDFSEDDLDAVREALVKFGASQEEVELLSRPYEAAIDDQGHSLSF